MPVPRWGKPGLNLVWSLHTSDGGGKLNGCNHQTRRNLPKLWTRFPRPRGDRPGPPPPGQRLTQKGDSGGLQHPPESFGNLGGGGPQANLPGQCRGRDHGPKVWRR